MGAIRGQAKYAMIGDVSGYFVDRAEPYLEAYFRPTPTTTVERAIRSIWTLD